MPVNLPAPRPDSPAAVEEGARKDKNFRRYASNVERALSLFDTALQEWADYIAFLGRLLKALQSKPSDTHEIPHKSTVAKRLAQCLDPMLPSGVHQKTLEVYAYVFAVLDSDGLSKDLPLYLPGLSPTLSFASLSVKPALLSLFETFIVHVDPAMLRSALKAILLSLLPGLEEETSEEFERTLALLKKFRKAVGKGLNIDVSQTNVTGDQYFWQSLFLASITGSSRRQGALAYMTRELPRLGRPSAPPGKPESLNRREIELSNRQSTSEIEAVTSPEPGLLIRCFAAGLQDEQLLIQRGFLDLLVTHLPLQSAVIHQKVVPGDLELLVAAASAVVGRREMSLNRRLWTWFLGPEPSAGAGGSPSSPSTPEPEVKTRPEMSQTDYFELYGMTTLVSAILKMFAKDGVVPSEMARPYRICLSLMDRWEVGSLVIPHVFLPALESVWQYQGTAPSKEAFGEVLRSANVFFDGIESSLIWAELMKLLIESLEIGQPNRLDLTLFIVTNFNIKEEEMLTLHMPLAMLALLIRLRQLTLDDSGIIRPPQGKHTLLNSAFKVATQLLDLIPQRVLTVGSSEPSLTTSGDRLELGSIQAFYRELQAGTEDVTPLVGIRDITSALRHNASQVIIQALKNSPECLEAGLLFLEKLIQKAPGLDRKDYEALISGLLQASISCSVNKGGFVTFPTLAALVSTAEVAHKASRDSGSSWNSDHRVRQILPGLLTQLWAYTSPSRPKHNVEAVRGLWRIHSISPDSQLVEGSIATLMLESDCGRVAQYVHIEGARRFATVWAHSGTSSSPHHDKRKSKHSEHFVLARPLLLLLDSLVDTKTELFLFVAGWLQSLSSLQRILDFLLYRLESSPYIATQEGWKKTLIQEVAVQSRDNAIDNASESVYYLQMISDLVKHSNGNIWAALNSRVDVSDFFVEAHSVGETGPAIAPDDDKGPALNVQEHLVHICMGNLKARPEKLEDSCSVTSELRRTSVLLLHQIISGRNSMTIAQLSLDIPLLETLSWSVEQSDMMLQLSLMDLILDLLKLYLLRKDTPSSPHRRTASRETVRSTSQISLSIDRGDKDGASPNSNAPPPELLDCLILGISSQNSHAIIDHWIRFLDSCLPFYASNAFQTIMPLVDCFTRTLESVFQSLRTMFEATSSGISNPSEPISVLNALLNGLEQVLARCHDQLLQDEGHTPTIKSPEQAQGFFGNMVSGVFAPEAQKSRSTAANNRLTVLLCFKDAVKVGFSIWSWGDIGLGTSPRSAATAASFNYTSLRLRNRTRRMLEHLLAAEALECLETLVEFWQRVDQAGGAAQSSTVVNLLHALEGSRPKNTIPALFNAIYSRTNPNVLDPVRRSTLTSELSDIHLATFLATYTKSMEDDALDEIWIDCMTFLRDVLGNPLPQRQTLPMLLEFTAILGEKIDNTNFGEQRKMRRDIGELFNRLLAATFTTKPLAFSQEPFVMANDERGTSEAISPPQPYKSGNSNDVVTVIAAILPNVSNVLVDTDRIVAATMTISTQILTPTFKWKAFPKNVTSSTLEILKTMSRIPEASRTWRKDVGEAFNDSKFFDTESLELIRNGWMPVLRQWVLQEKERIPELLSRLSSPTSAGIMFGVGASSARLEADRRTQLNLRRVALLMLSADNDTFIVHMSGLQEKLVDLMSATAASSPSSATRADVYMCLRALVLKNTPVHLSSFWPIISTELYDTLANLSPTDTHGPYNINCVLEAAKLLDTLLTIAPDDFQLREWLFVTDTIDAVYRPSNWRPVALVDGLAEVLDSKVVAPQSAIAAPSSIQGGRKPLLTWQNTHEVPKESVVDRVLRPFMRQLSMNAFESTYRLETADREACIQDLLQDVFDTSTIV